ncbi:MAG: aldo/keto reductase [Gammaproteobacteria bacterium]|nr:MAG: aldo/keto reductase [Gammaproteobacteria bacterium]
METKPLGSSGLEVTSVGIGCMMFGAMCDQQQTNDIVAAALDAGINFFDTADIYGGPHGKSEELLGKALGPRRQQVIIGTKFGAGGRRGAIERGGSREYIMQAVEQSLSLLGTDYIDLYQHHFPDSETPLEETLQALDDLVRQGKVRHIGCSNYSGAQLAEAAEIASDNGLSSYVSAQNRYSLLVRDIEQDLVPVAQRLGIGILPYFPLESGLLTGKYRKGQALPEDSRFAKWGGGGAFLTDERLDIVEQLADYAESIGRSVLDLAIGWLAAQAHVSSVIAGVTRPAQVLSNVAAASWQPAPEQLAEIGRIATP